MAKYPAPNGVQSTGTSSERARLDHVHPSDPSKVDKKDLARVALTGSYNDLTDKPEDGGDFPIYTPQDFGAVGDGVTDDSAAIQAAIQAAQAQGCIVLGGSYYTEATIQIPDYVEFKCAEIDYHGSGAAVQLTGSYSKFDCNTLKSSGTCALLVQPLTKIQGQTSAGQYNWVHINEITCETGHGIWVKTLPLATRQANIDAYNQGIIDALGYASQFVWYEIGQIHAIFGDGIRLEPAFYYRDGELYDAGGWVTRQIFNIGHADAHIGFHGMRASGDSHVYCGDFVEISRPVNNEPSVQIKLENSTFNRFVLRSAEPTVATGEIRQIQFGGACDGNHFDMTLVYMNSIDFDADFDPKSRGIEFTGRIVTYFPGNTYRNTVAYFANVANGIFTYNPSVTLWLSTAYLEPGDFTVGSELEYIYNNVTYNDLVYTDVYVRPAHSDGTAFADGTVITIGEDYSNPASLAFGHPLQFRLASMVKPIFVDANGDEILDTTGGGYGGKTLVFTCLGYQDVLGKNLWDVKILESQESASIPVVSVNGKRGIVTLPTLPELTTSVADRKKVLAWSGSAWDGRDIQPLLTYSESTNTISGDYTTVAEIRDVVLNNNIYPVIQDSNSVRYYLSRVTSKRAIFFGHSEMNGAEILYTLEIVVDDNDPTQQTITRTQKFAVPFCNAADNGKSLNVVQGIPAWTTQKAFSVSLNADGTVNTFDSELTYSAASSSVLNGKQTKLLVAWGNSTFIANSVERLSGSNGDVKFIADVEHDGIQRHIIFTLTSANALQTTLIETYSRVPVTVWEVQDVTQGLIALNTNISSSLAWQLTGLNLAPFKRIKIYVRAGRKTGSLSADSSITPASIIEMSLDDRAKETVSQNAFLAGSVVQNPNDPNRLGLLTCAVSGDKTKFAVLRATTLYGTAATSNTDAYPYVFLIEGYYD